MIRIILFTDSILSLCFLDEVYFPGKHIGGIHNLAQKYILLLFSSGEGRKLPFALTSPVFKAGLYW